MAEVMESSLGLVSSLNLVVNITNDIFIEVCKLNIAQQKKL